MKASATDPEYLSMTSTCDMAANMSFQSDASMRSNAN